MFGCRGELRRGEWICPKAKVVVKIKLNVTIFIFVVNSTIEACYCL